MSMMQPQGAPPGGPQQGPPPELLAMLAQHAAQQNGGPAPAPSPQPPDQGGGDERQAIQILQQMISLGNQFIQVEPDATDKATMAKLLSTLHQYLAKEQTDAESALGGGPGTRLLRRLGTS